MGVVWKRGAWWIDYRYNGQRYRRKVGPIKTLAENAFRKVKLEIAENKFLDIRRYERVSFYELCDLYIELHAKPNKRHWERNDINNIKRLKEYFGNPPIHEITQEMIEKFKAKRTPEVSPATVNRELSCIKHMFTKAVEWDKIKYSPAVKVKKLKENNSRLRYLEKEEIKKLLANCNDTLRPVVILAIYTGMRQGELLKLKWHDIDVNKGIIYILNTKNNEPREIPMCDIVRQALIGIPKHQDSPYIFCKKNGKPYGKLRKSFLQALDKSDILNFRFHDLRHTFASQLAMSGVDLNTIRELLGHKSLQMTLRYSHLSRDHKRRAMESFGKQMDTIWTPEAKVAEIGEIDFSHKLLYNKELM